MANHRSDIAGHRFGRLTAIEPVSKTKKGEFIWRCLCDCGQETNVALNNLKHGQVRSCGCLAKEQASKAAKKWHVENPHNHATHGQSKTRLYTIWTHMRQRCRDVGNRQYHDRGIRVCREWDQSFESFRDWSLQNGYREDLSIDRIDNNGDYEPQNCRWTDTITQSNNRRTNRMVTYQGKTMTLANWCRELGLKYGTISQRISIRGWTEEEALRGYRD